MPRKHISKRVPPKPKTVLRLPDLDQAKSAVLNSLSSVDGQRGYRHAIDEFVEWYCSEPRLSFSRTVVLLYRIHLESRLLAPPHHRNQTQQTNPRAESWTSQKAIRGKRQSSPGRRSLECRAIRGVLMTSLNLMKGGREPHGDTRTD